MHSEVKYSNLWFTYLLIPAIKIALVFSKQSMQLFNLESRHEKPSEASILPERKAASSPFLIYSLCPSEYNSSVGVGV